ncbi:nucleotide-binding protein [Kribbella sp. NPDC026611]|uniref:nucleotide-binding protein n=1 Tax=Kribbella sp. NPDC026611 TaxID=3154911 RepID=UPI0033CE4A9D
MIESVDALVFDTGPMRHFTVEGWLGVLKFLAGGRRVLIPESVEREIKHQAHDLPVLQQVLDIGWIEVDRSNDLPFVMAFAEYERRLAVGQRNLGECGVLALGRTRGFETVLDDSVPRKIAEEEGIRVTATLPLLCNAIRESQLTVSMVESLADDLITGSYFLPFERGGFRKWACEEGLIEYE